MSTPTPAATEAPKPQLIATGLKTKKQYLLRVTDTGRVFTDPTTGEEYDDAGFKALEGDYTQARGYLSNEAKKTGWTGKGNRRLEQGASDAPVVVPEMGGLGALAEALKKKVAPAMEPTPMPTMEPKKEPTKESMLGMDDEIRRAMEMDEVVL